MADSAVNTVPSSRRRIDRLALLLALPLATSGPALAISGDLSGTHAQGSISYFFLICSTCTKPSDNLFSDYHELPGSPGPAVVIGSAARGTGTSSVSAHSRLTGLNSLPDVGAAAQATPGVGTHPGFAEEGAYFFSAFAAGRGAQYFQYNGSSDTLYTLAYTLTGEAFNLELPPSQPGNAAIQIEGGLSLYDGKDPNPELPYGQLIDSHRSSFNGSDHAFAEVGSVSIVVSPGDGFYALSYVEASVAFLGYGYADAAHTLHVEFTAGDTRLLTPFLQAVPEPGSYGLMAVGLLGVLGAVRGRRAAARAHVPGS